MFYTFLESVDRPIPRVTLNFVENMLQSCCKLLIASNTVEHINTSSGEVTFSLRYGRNFLELD